MIKEATSILIILYTKGILNKDAHNRNAMNTN